MSEKYLCDNVPINDKFDKNCVKIDDNNLNSDKHLLHLMDKEKQFFVCNGVYVYNRGSCVMNPDIKKLITNPQSNIGASSQPVVQPEVQPAQPVVQPAQPVVQPAQPEVQASAFTEMTGKYCGPFPGDDACKTDDTSDKCFPKSNLDECKASCGNDCSGISYDAGRKWCIKCDNLNDVISHSAWNTYKNDNHSVGGQPEMLDEPIYKGCYQDSSTRTLPTHHSGNLTKDQCRDKAKEQKHKYFGLQYWQGDGNIMTGQCFSANELPKDKIDGCKSGGSYNVGGAWENAVYSFVKEEVKTFQCPAEFPHLKPWRNDPKHSVWCYKSEAGTGAACNIPEDGVLAEGQKRGFNGSFATCAVETKPLEPEPTMCTIPQTTWINSKMGNDGWSQAQGEGAQNCKVPSNLQSRITN